MTTPKNTSSDNPSAVTFSHTNDEQVVTEASHYSPTDFDGDYHVEQDDETDS